MIQISQRGNNPC